MANPTLRPIYEYSVHPSTGQFLYSNLPDVTTPGWTRDGIAFFAFGKSHPGVVAVFRYDATGPQRFQYTTNSAPTLGTGWLPGGTAFHAFTSPRADTIPVFEYSATSPQRFRYSTNPSLADTVWHKNGEAFHVFAAQPE